MIRSSIVRSIANVVGVYRTTASYVARSTVYVNLKTRARSFLVCLAAIDRAPCSFDVPSLCCMTAGDLRLSCMRITMLQVRVERTCRQLLGLLNS